MNYLRLSQSLIYLIDFQDYHNISTPHTKVMKPTKKNSDDSCFFEDNSPSFSSFELEEQPEQRQEDNQGIVRKTKPIKKDEKASNPRAEITQRRNRYEQQENSDPNRPRGRPKGDRIQSQHLQRSRQYNDIIYHYSKLLIYFYIMKGKDDGSSYALALQNKESLWMKQAADIMSMDNFPANINLRRECFLLHPNSLHFIFFHNKINKISKYEPEQIKYYLLEFLRRRNLLTMVIHAYICQYWKDILCLVLEWKKDQVGRQKSIRAKQLYIENESSREPQLQTRDDLRNDLEKEHSIVAYEIACYLKCCCDRFSFQISPQRKS